jgi:hypothetical protein
MVNIRQYASLTFPDGQRKRNLASLSTSACHYPVTIDPLQHDPVTGPLCICLQAGPVGQHQTVVAFPYCRLPSSLITAGKARKSIGKVVLPAFMLLFPLAADGQCMIIPFHHLGSNGWLCLGRR